MFRSPLRQPPNPPPVESFIKCSSRTSRDSDELPGSKAHIAIMTQAMKTGIRANSDKTGSLDDKRYGLDLGGGRGCRDVLRSGECLAISILTDAHRILYDCRAPSRQMQAVSLLGLWLRSTRSHVSSCTFAPAPRREVPHWSGGGFRSYISFRAALQSPLP